MEDSESSYLPPALTHAQVPTINILCQTGTFGKIDEPSLTHRYHPKFMIFITIPS